MSDVADSSLAVTLPDGSRRDLPAGATGFDLAKSISKRLAKQALAVRVNGDVQDLARPLPDGAEVTVLTEQDDDPDVLWLIRHDTAHVMAEAVQDLFPGTQVTIGPPVEAGFYYDFYRPESFSPEDLEKIEARMAEIAAEDKPFEREVWEREEAKRVFRDMGEDFKVELIDELPADAEVTIYRQGQWFDLCRGPHGPSTGRVAQRFKLTKLAGAYWRGDPQRPQLQRIYGTAWRSGKELKAYLDRLAEAERRDHRKLGRQLDLFHTQEEAAGSVFWHPKGWALYRSLEAYIRRRLDADGYQEVRTPQLIDRSLWERSGHWDKFRDNMFVIPMEDERALAVKPMNCPAHVQIFKQGVVSYRDLPIRMAEFGCCHRNEASGSLHGLMRVRQMTQDDAHIFCRDDQITPESQRFCDLLMQVYKDLGFDDVAVKLATRPPVRAGDDAVWDQAENGLEAAVQAAGLSYEMLPGEGAFYGPKLEFHLTDAIGRSWQCGTLQLDFVLPERLDAEYVGQDGARHRPVMLHRAILGSLERFIGILVEHYAGKLPTWLAPVQVVVATITNDVDGYAGEVAAALRRAGVRASLDRRNEKITYKVREHSNKKVPVILVVGQQEAENRHVNLRRLGSKAQEDWALDAAVAALAEEASSPVGPLIDAPAF